MLDIKLIRKEPEKVKNSLIRRKMDPAVIDEILKIDEKRRDIIVKSDGLKNTRNTESKKVGKMKKAGEDITQLSNQIRGMGDEIKRLEDELNSLEKKQQEILSGIPNIPSEKVPDGEDDTQNIEIRRWGNIRQFDFQPKPHWDIGENLGILDSSRAVKMAKTRFTMLRGAGALLERALIQFMLDIHTKEHGYIEFAPPFMVNYDTLFGTGQLPKFEEDLFKIDKYNMYLIPTAEVPLTGFHRDEILEEKDLPLYYTAYTPCFRSEAGSAGKDTRGLIRVHQFSKVELVKLVHPDKSYEELEKMVKEASTVLERLEIPYRVVTICLGDLGFSASFKYDLEIWAPGQNRWMEISSCSNCSDFQARRSNIKFRPTEGKKLDWVHTLNGSGVAVGRTIAAILENFQNSDGSVTVPPNLRKYMHGMEEIRA